METNRNNPQAGAADAGFDPLTVYPWIQRVLRSPDSWRQKARRTFRMLSKPAATGWIVVALGDSVTGEADWISDLDSPQSWVPGVLAVPVADDDGYHVAMGGDHYAGALRWVRLCGDRVAKRMSPGSSESRNSAKSDQVEVR